MEEGVGAGGVHAHLPNVRVAAVEMILDDSELQGEAVHPAAAARFNQWIVVRGEGGGVEHLRSRSLPWRR